MCRGCSRVDSGRGAAAAGWDGGVGMGVGVGGSGVDRVGDSQLCFQQANLGSLADVAARVVWSLIGFAWGNCCTIRRC